MREEQLRLEHFEDFRISGCRGIQEVNEHMQYCFEGMIPMSKMKEYAALGEKDTWVHVYTLGEQGENIWLCGWIKDMMFQVTGQTCKMSLILGSGTALMDLKEHIRTFQGESITYEQLLDTCNSTYEYAAKIMTAGKKETVGKLMVQYRETDWEFIKRLASQKQTVVVADAETKGCKYYFGLPARDNTIMGDMQEYRTQFDIKTYWEKQNQGLSVLPQDFIYYIWESRDVYYLGDVGIIDGRAMTVWKIETLMSGNELYHTYYMKPKSGFYTAEKENTKLAGTSLLGTITGVKGEQVQATIREDENSGNGGSRWFPYATVYSSADGTGWYCMPEPGDLIHLHFPTGRESDAYVISAYHEKESSLRSDPSCKFWRNKQGKEIRLAKDRIIVTNNNGTYMELSDETGINIVSDGAVHIQAGGSMELSSNTSLIELSAQTKVSIRQGTTELVVDKSGFNVKGAKVKI